MSRHNAERLRSGPAPVFAALGDPTRLRLVTRLSDGRPRSIVQLNSNLPLTRQAVTKHLRVLESAGIVHREHVGRESRFSLVPDRIEQARSYLDGISAQWDAALERLQAFVED